MTKQNSRKNKRNFDFKVGDLVYFKTRRNTYLPAVVDIVNEVNRVVQGTVYEEDGVTPIAELVWGFDRIYKEI